MGGNTGPDVAALPSPPPVSTVSALRTPCPGPICPLVAPTVAAKLSGFPMTQPAYDVIAIGNAIVDVMAPCDDAT